MEKLFKALGNKDCLWIVQRLSADGPTRQKNLAIALGESGRKRPNTGTMSAWIKRLVDAGLVEQDGQQDAVRLTNDEQVRLVLTHASALTVAVTTKAQKSAEAQHAELMRAITKAQDDQAAEG